jgi:hypothetical protein
MEPTTISKLPDKLRIAKLPSGLELWFNEEGAYTVPPRSGTDEVQQTLTEVELWSRTRSPAHPEAVAVWLESFEDQYPYLSRNMPERQRREVSRESSKEILERLFGARKT